MTGAMQLRRTHRISWMINGWLRPDTLGPDNGGTACLTLGCPDDFHAVRLGFPNVTPAPWTIAAAIGCASGSFNDYVNPTGAGRWTRFTFAMQGRDDDRIAARPDAPTGIIVAPNDADEATGETGNPAWTWTDWVPLPSEDADPLTGMRVLMLRALVPAGQTVCVANGQLRGLTGNPALNHGCDYFVGGLKHGIDRVTAPSARESADAWRHNGLANGCLFPLVQFLTRRAGIVGIGTGDSHQQGTSTTEQFTGFLYRSTVALARRHVGQVPFGMVNCAAGGLTSAQFFQRLDALLAPVRPSFAVLPGWTYNDRNGAAHADAEAMRPFFGRLLRAIETCTVHGVQPILLTPFPRDRNGMTPAQLAPWQGLRHAILTLEGAGLPVIDAALLLGSEVNGMLDGTYLSNLTLDGSHPADSGHDAIASWLIRAIETAGDVATGR